MSAALLAAFGVALTTTLRAPALALFARSGFAPAGLWGLGVAEYGEHEAAADRGGFFQAHFNAHAEREA